MAYVEEYWRGRTQRARHAASHTEKMERDYHDMIVHSSKNTELYTVNFKKDSFEKRGMLLKIQAIDSVSAILEAPPGKTAVLNFASYKNPGGMFLAGSKAQEECLCHESFLYNVLGNNMWFYDWNNGHKNKSLYLNRALYSPDIIFMRDGKQKKCDVITCAAPNKSSAQEYCNVTDEENKKVLDSRIRFVLDIAADNQVDNLVLGAYGCGVFGQDPKEVASIFKKYLFSTHLCFNYVVFAIPNGNDGNLEAFKSQFRD